jgi:hypothetical protein
MIVILVLKKIQITKIFSGGFNFMANNSRASKRTGFGTNRGGINPPFHVGNVAPQSPINKQVHIDTENYLLKFYNQAAWDIITGTVLLANATNAALITLSGSSQTIISKQVNVPTSSKTYQVNFCSIIGSSGSTVFKIFVDSVEMRSFSFSSSTVNFSKLLTLANGVRTIEIIATGTGTISAGNAELGVYL